MYMKAQFFNRVTNYFKIGMLVLAMGFVVGYAKDNSESKTIIGTWTFSNEHSLRKATFNDDKTFSISIYSPEDVEIETITGKYRINENKIVFIYDNDPDVDDAPFFEVDEDDIGDFLIIHHYHNEEEPDSIDFESMKWRRMK